jgi:hypothetical protein
LLKIVVLELNFHQESKLNNKIIQFHCDLLLVATSVSQATFKYNFQVFVKGYFVDLIHFICLNKTYFFVIKNIQFCVFI